MSNNPECPAHILEGKTPAEQARIKRGFENVTRDKSPEEQARLTERFVRHVQRFVYDYLPWEEYKPVGFWTEREHPEWPNPNDLPTRDWEPGLKEIVVAYLRTFKAYQSYRGWATCRICDKPLGSRDYTDNTWVWPEQFEHYIEEHSLDLPEDFLKHIKDTIGEESLKTPWETVRLLKLETGLDNLRLYLQVSEEFRLKDDSFKAIQRMIDGVHEFFQRGL